MTNGVLGLTPQYVAILSSVHTLKI